MCKSELAEFLAELTEFAAKLSEFSLPKQYSRNSIPPVPYTPVVKLKNSKHAKEVEARIRALVAPYCATPRDYLSDTPYCVLRAMGFFGVSSWPIGRDTPPHKRGIFSAILARNPMKTRQNACDTSLWDTISKGYCKRYGGVSRIGPV